MENVTVLLDRIEEVCPMPAAVQRVLAKIDDPRASVGEVAAAVGLDASLSAEVLRLANSPIYGRSRGVASLGEAVSTVGLNELKNMATAMAMLAAFASEHERAPELHELAVIRGAIAGALARRQGTPPAVAYLAALLADIGGLALLAVDPKGFSHILEQVGPDLEKRAPMETQEYGMPSNAIGAELLRRNGLPGPVVEAVLGDAPAPDKLVSLVAAARRSAVEVHRSQDVADKLPELAALFDQCGCPMESQEVAELLVEAGQQTKGMFKAAS